MNRALVLRLRVARRSLSQVAGPTTTTSAEVPIEIPKRIPRGPTDILRALASTVKQDYTAADYKYIDDPMLIPVSANTRKMYSVSRESGRNAARFILQKFPECFVYNPADPKIAAFDPPEKVFSEDGEHTLEDLKYFIEKVQVLPAQSIFKNLQQKGVEVPQDTLLSLLQLLSFYNCKEGIDESLIESHWFAVERREQMKTWADGNLAENIFEMIEDKNALAYGALIQGMAKYFQLKKAFALYEEMSSKGLIPPVTTYNYLIERACLVCEGEQNRWELITSLVSSMTSNRVRPNLQTFNALLCCCTKLGNALKAKKIALQVLADMRASGVEPSLATYHFLLQTFCKSKGPISDILKDILPLITEKIFVVRDKDDLSFFRTALAVCHEHLVDKELAYQVIEMMDKHIEFAGNASSVAKCYTHFLGLLCSTESVEAYMDVLFKYVPHRHMPDRSLIYETLEAIELNDAFQYLPRFWSDVISPNFPARARMLSKMLSVMAKFKSAGDPVSNELQQTFVTIAKTMRSNMDAARERNRADFFEELTAEATTDMIQTFLNGGAMSEAWQSVQDLVKRQMQLTGVPNIGPLQLFVERACADKQQDQALFCAKYCSEVGYSTVADWMRDNADKYELSETTRQRLESLVSPPTQPSES